MNRWISPDPLEVHVGGSGDLNVYAYVSGQALKNVDPVGLSSQPSNVEAPSEMNCHGACGGPQSSPIPATAQPAPAPRPTTLEQGLAAADAYADKVVEQLKSSATAQMTPGVVQTTETLKGQWKSAQSAHNAARTGDLGGFVMHGLAVTPFGQALEGLGGRIGTGAYQLGQSWKAGDVGGAVRAGIDLKRGAEETGVMIAGIVSGPYGQLTKAGASDAHHVIQHAAVRDLPGYSKSAAPSVQLPGPSTRVGSPHYKATQVQRQRGGGTYAAERRIGYKALRRAGFDKAIARQLIQAADDYFASLGVNATTPTRIPGNR